MSICLRHARAADCDLLFDWVNSPDSLAGKLLTKEVIARPDHEQWFQARLVDPDTAIWIIEKEEMPAGQVRLMRNGDAFDVDIYVALEYRGEGTAQIALAQAIESIRAAGSDEPAFRARIKRDNQSSVALFERAGFRLSSTFDDHAIYLLKSDSDELGD